MIEPMSVGESSLTADWSQAVPWILVAVGWIVVNHQNNLREIRKEVRAKLDAIKKLIDEIEELSIQHHTDKQDLMRCLKIKRGFVNVSREMRATSNAGLEIVGVSNALTKFKQAVTIRNFESSAYVVLELNNEIIVDINLTSDSLRARLESAYSEKFHRSIFRKNIFYMSSRKTGNP